MGTIAVVVDITDKKCSRSLRKSEEKYRALVENSWDLIARFDREHRILYANPAFSRIMNILRIPARANTSWFLIYQVNGATNAMMLLQK